MSELDTEYPGALPTYRTIENIPSQQFDTAKQTTVYVEDLLKLRNEVNAICSTLGLDPAGTHDTVVERLGGVDVLLSYLAGLQDVPFYNDTAPEDMPAIQIEFGRMRATFASASKQKSFAITHQRTYTTIAITIPVFQGDKATTGSYPDHSNNVKGPVACKAVDQGLSGCTIWVHTSDGTNWSTNNSVAVAWLTIGY